jgi:hypothetical protein
VDDVDAVHDDGAGGRKGRPATMRMVVLPAPFGRVEDLAGRGVRLRPPTAVKSPYLFVRSRFRSSGPEGIIADQPGDP